MGRPFEFSAANWQDFQNQPCVHPGKVADRTDNDGHSGVPEGGPVPYGRVLVRGLQSSASTNAEIDLSARYFTFNDSVSLPDKNGEYLCDDDGQTYATAGVSLPLDSDGELMVAGIGMWTEYGSCSKTRLQQPFGLGDYHYQDAKNGMVGMCIEGNIWCYCETDIDVGDTLFFRTVVTDASDGVQLLGAFSNAGGSEFQEFKHGKVFRPGPAGGAFVLTMNLQK